MAGFQDAYAELFGEQPAYEPIDTTAYETPRPQQAIRTGKALASPGGLSEGTPFMAAYQELLDTEPPPEAAPTDEDPRWSDYAKQFGAGAVELGATVAGVPEYLARQVGSEGAAQALAAPRRAMQGYAEEIRSTMTPEAIARASREWTTLDPGKTIWQGGVSEFVSALALQATGAAPSTLGTMLPGVLMLRAGLRAGAITYLGASEGTLSVGSIANNVAEEIEAAPEDELMQSQRYQQLRQEMDQDAARQQLIGESQGMAPAIGGFVVGLISAGAGRYLEPKIIGSGAGVSERFARGALSEAFQEGPQGGAETIAQNIAAEVYDSSRPVMQGVLESVVSGAAVGAPLGGTINAAFGARPRTALPPLTEPPLTEPPPPAPPPTSFQEVFGEGGEQPQGPANFDDVFTAPDSPANRATQYDKDSARMRYVEDPQPALRRRALMSDALVSGHVDPALMAAMNARKDGMIEDLFEQPMGQTPQEEQETYLRQQATPGQSPTYRWVTAPDGTRHQELVDAGRRNTPLHQQEEMALPPAPTGIMQAPIRDTNQLRQPPLLDERQRGTSPQPLQPIAAQPYQEDLSPPDDYAGLTPPMVRDENQRDLFAQPPQAEDDASAEPLSDLLAQLDDLRDPDSPRKGVYLSASNIENLRANGAFEQVRGTGVPLADFDGRGGTLIAKNRQAAEELLDMQAQSAGNMQEVLGYATGAGTGKSASAQIVVQQRDDNGSVVRESLVETPEEADALATSWEDETGQETAILSSAQALRRRQQKIRQENQQRIQQRSSRQVARETETALEEELNEDEAYQVRRGMQPAASRADAASQIIRQARKARGKELQLSWGDLADPSTLEFERAEDAETYQDLFLEHAGQQVVYNTSQKISERRAAKERQAELRERLTELRELAGATTQSERVARAASKLSPQETQRERRYAEMTARRRRRRANTREVVELTDDEIDALEGEDLQREFLAAAEHTVGQERSKKQGVYEFPTLEMAEQYATLEAQDALNSTKSTQLRLKHLRAQRVLTHRPEQTLGQLVATHTTPSEQRKVIRRVQSTLVSGRHGGGVESADLTKKAVEKEGSDHPVRESVFDTRVLSVERPQPELSEAKRDALRERGRKAFKALTQALQDVSVQLERVAGGEFATALAEREPDGSLTDDARQMLFARAYLRVLAEYGVSLQLANNRASASALGEVEAFNKLIGKVGEMSAKQFATQMSNLYYAEQRESVTKAARSDPRILGNMAYVSKRAAITQKSTQKLHERIQHLERIEKFWKQDEYYRSQVGPLMHKFTESIVNRGAMTYTPTLAELRAVQFAMKIWRGKKETRDNIYRPIQRFFTDLGVDFSQPFPDDFKWETPDKLLARRSRFGRGTEKDAGLTGLPGDSLLSATKQAEQFSAQIKYQVRQKDYGTPYTATQVARLSRMKTYNEAVNAMLGQLKSSATVLDIIRAEEQFIQTLRDLKLWEWTRQSSGLAKLTTPGFARDTETSMRSVTARLRTREVTKDEAMEMLTERYPPVGFSQESRAEPTSGEAAVRTLQQDILPQRAMEAELRELLRASDMTVEQRRLLEAYQRREDSKELEYVVKELRRDMPGVVRSAQVVAEMLEDSSNFPTAVQVLERAAAALPQGSRFRTVMERLASVPGMENVKVAYDRSGKVLNSSLGRYSTYRTDGAVTSRTIIINRAMLNEYRATGADPHIPLLHALTHEATHAATYGAIENNPQIKVAVRVLMQQVEQAMRARGIDTRELYAFRDRDPHEFIAEVYSNARFQRQLKETKVDPQLTAWQAILRIVRRILGLQENPQYADALEAVMSLTDTLFTGETKTLTRGAEAALSMELDGTVKDIVGNTLDRFLQSARTTQTLRRRARDKITGWILPAATMEQLRDTYSRHFQKGGKNSMAEFMSAFFSRNADNSARMEKADKRSREWTALAEADPKNAVETSQLMSEATIHKMHPNMAFNADENAHLKTDTQRKKHMELSARFNALPQKFQDLYEDVAEYYETSQQQEVALMTLNVLRGHLTEGDDAPLTAKEFDYTEEDIEGMGLNTLEGLQSEFGGLLKSEDLKTIYNIASIPRLREGPYFPLMRFGDYVVYAEREVSRKQFGTDRKAAQAFRAEQLANDPTLDVSVKQADNGAWLAIVTDKEFRMAETRSEAETNEREMVEMYGREATSRVQLKAELFAAKATIGSSHALSTLMDKLQGNPAGQAALKNFYLQSLADSSFRKREQTRSNRRGVDYDQQHRTFANYAKSAAYYTSQLRFGWKMAAARRDMEQAATAHRDESEVSAVRMGEVVREIKLRDDLTVDPHELSKLAKHGTELGHFMLLTSPSYWMINATQPYTVTLPWLAAHSSYSEAAIALAHAQKLIFAPLASQAGKSWGGLKALKSKAAAEQAFSVLEQVEERIANSKDPRAKEYLRMLTALKRESIIDLSFVAELRDVASGKTSVWQNVLDASRIMAHLTEVNNRIMTAMASYDIARSKGADESSAIDFAKQATSQTQFNYSAANKPRLFQAQGPLGKYSPLVFQFMQYPQHMYALMLSNLRIALGNSPGGRKIALKTLGGIFATHLAAAGAIGMTLQPVKWAIGLAAFLFGDDDEPFDFDRWIREGADELFGTELGAIAAGGLPRAFGVDLSQRMSLGTLYMVDLKTDNATSFMGSLMQSFGGPLVGMSANAFQGGRYAMQGDLWKGLEMVEPKFLKDLSKAFRFSSQGMTDFSGKVVLDADQMAPTQLFLQSMGLNPAQVSDKYARDQAKKDAQQHDTARKATLLRRFQRAKTPEDRQQVAIEVSEFNKANPESFITYSALMRSLTGSIEAEERIQRLGGNFRGSQVLYAERGKAYDTYEEDIDDALFEE